MISEHKRRLHGANGNLYSLDIKYYGCLTVPGDTVIMHRYFHNLTDTEARALRKRIKHKGFYNNEGTLINSKRLISITTKKRERFI